MKKPIFLVDMGISWRLVDVLKKEGFESCHARDLELAKASDAEIVKYAGKNNFVIITRDFDFPRILVFAGQKLPGVVVLKVGNISTDQIVEIMLKALPGLLPNLENSICIVEKTRIRVHKLPIVEENE